MKVPWGRKKEGLGIGKAMVEWGKEMGQDEGEEWWGLGGSSDLSALLEDGVVDATADAPQALIPSGHCLTCQAQGMLMGLLPEEEKEFLKIYPHVYMGLMYNSGGIAKQ